MIHPNASVLALGILLCELHYCTPVELMAKNPQASRSVNNDYYTCIEKLQTLEDDVGMDYYLATKACLTGDYYPRGEPVDFAHDTVQQLFYQNVVKRLEAVIFKAWNLRLEDLRSLNVRQNESCWGAIGREVVRFHTGRVNFANASSTARAGPSRSLSDTTSMSYTALSSDVVLQPSQQSYTGSHAQGRLAKPSKENLYFFDASHQTGPEA
jgi:hypothetical protein